MARITVEDCLQNVPNLFQLVMVASKRARKLANGAEATVDWENDKMTVVALRLTGGVFGPENSIVTIAVVILSLAVMVPVARKRNRFIVAPLPTPFDRSLYATRQLAQENRSRTLGALVSARHRRSG